MIVLIRPQATLESKTDAAAVAVVRTDQAVSRRSSHLASSMRKIEIMNHSARLIAVPNNSPPISTPVLRPSTPWAASSALVWAAIVS